jgi:quercetin dioxygenase-like cupin family protein
VRHTADVEIKWGVHPAGEKREQWSGDDHRTTLVVLVSGRFVVHLDDGRADFTEPGDYVMWGPGTGHSWEALADSIVMTVRWPSTETASR